MRIPIESLSEFFGAEVRPQNVGKIKFRIGALPQKEIGKPHLAARPYNEVDIGQSSGVKPGGNIFFGNLRFAALEREVHRTRYLRARTVIKGDVQNITIKFPGLFDGV